jgi:hypothetical protein
MGQHGFGGHAIFEVIGEREYVRVFANGVVEASFQPLTVVNHVSNAIKSQWLMFYSKRPQEFGSPQTNFIACSGDSNSSSGLSAVSGSQDTVRSIMNRNTVRRRAKSKYFVFQSADLDTNIV